MVTNLRCFCFFQIKDKLLNGTNAGRKIATNTGANATKFFTLATKS